MDPPRVDVKGRLLKNNITVKEFLTISTSTMWIPHSNQEWPHICLETLPVNLTGDLLLEHLDHEIPALPVTKLPM